MKLKEAIKILMESASLDVRGSGLGYRITTDVHRRRVTQAWIVAFKYVYKREPDASEISNAGMLFYTQEMEGK